jgi:phospholipase A1
MTVASDRSTFFSRSAPRRALALASLLAISAISHAETGPEACARIVDHEQRLACFDVHFPPPEDLPASGDTADDVTPVEARRNLEYDATLNWFAITPHKPNYLLPVAHNFSADYSAYSELGPTFSDTEVKFQVSLKTLLLPIGWRNSSIWAGYTQQSYWQLYAEEAASSPFRETNHEPELFWEVPIRFRLFGLDARFAYLGFNHQSNGQSGDLSRSWNRLTGQIVAERGRFVATAKTWVRLPEGIGEDDNPNIEDYMGRIQLGAAWRGEFNTFSISLKNNLRTENRSGLEVGWTFPLSRHLKGYVQLYTGYGENLIDMENYTNRISLGFALTDWL